MLRLRFGILPKVLLRPKEAFGAIKNDASLAEGIIIAVVMLLIAQILSVSIMGASVSPFGILPLPKVGAGAGAVVLGTALGLIVLILAGVFASVVSGMERLEMGGRRNIRRTITLLGYTTVLTAVQSLVTTVIIVGFMSAAVGTSAEDAGFGLLVTGIGISVMLVSILFGLWGFIIGGRAVAEANETHSLGEGILSLVIGYVIVTMIVMMTVR